MVCYIYLHLQLTTYPYLDNSVIIANVCVFYCSQSMYPQMFFIIKNININTLDVLSIFIMSYTLPLVCKVEL